MKTFLALRPPAEYGQLITNFQARLVPPQFVTRTPPHITLMRPLPLEPKGEWLEKVARQTAEHPALPVVVGPPAWFDYRVLYLSVISSELLLFHHLLLRLLQQHLTTDPYLGANFTPHLTLAKGDITPDLRRNLTWEAEQALAPYPHFAATELAVFIKVNPQDAYQVSAKLPFKM